MLRTLGLAITGVLRIVKDAAVLAPTLLYRRAAACRIFAHQLQQYGIPEDEIQQLTKYYRDLGKFF